MSGLPRGKIDDAEGANVPLGLDVIDAHVHLFPDAMFDAIVRWFDDHAWTIRYRLHAEEVVAFLRAHGVAGCTGLCYAHRPGLSRGLNAWMAELARAHRDFLLPLGTVLPGEPDAGAIVREALGPLRLRGIKIHCHVQRLSPDDPRLEDVYGPCEDAGLPVLIHAGREPSSAAYGVDTRALCGADQIDAVLRRHPRLKMIVPHFGADEFEAYAALLDRHEHLYLDTAMCISGFFEHDVDPTLVVRHARRLLFGSDFPNLPYAWDRELVTIAGLPLDDEARRALFSGNARRLFGD